MKKAWWIVLIFLLVAGLWYISAQKTLPVQYTKMLSEKGPYEVETQKVKYYQQIDGFLAKPVKTGIYPGIVMIHDRWGLNNNILNMANLLSSFGYKVLAVDLYNGIVAKTEEDTQKQIGSLDQENAILNMKEAVNFLRKNESAPKIASIGWDFGAGQALKLSLSGEEFDATVIYYGNLLLETKKLQPISWPVLGVFGDKDTQVPVESALVFDKVLSQLGASHEILIYPGVGHDFTNPASTNYAAKESADAWTKTVLFLDKNLRK